MSNIQPQTTGIRIVEKEVKTPSRLSDDARPVLSGDLDGNTKNIKNVGDISTKTINGKDIFAWIQEEFKKLSTFVSSGFATKKHFHEMCDIADLKEELENIPKSMKEEVALMLSRLCSEKSHRHSPEDIEELRQYILEVASALPVKPHFHMELEGNVSSLTSSLEKVDERVSEAIKETEIEDRVRSISAAQDMLANALVSLKQEIANIAASSTNGEVITISVEEKSKDIAEVVQSEVPYVILPDAPNKYNIEVTDATGQELPVEILGSVVNFKRTEGPYTITFYRK